MKKLSLVLILALVLCALPVAAHAEGTLTVYNWYDYIDESVLDDFTAETGIKVDYVMFTTVEEMYVKMTTGGGKYEPVRINTYKADPEKADDDKE